jgi:ATP-dependent DNA helicase RecG
LTTIQKAVLDYLRGNPQAGRVEIAKCLGNVSEDGVKFIIGRLQQLGLLKREGGRKHGKWVVIDNNY